MTGEAQPPAACVGCGVVVDPAQGPTHPYMRSSPGCWSRFGELLASGAAPMAVDAYAVQHPGVPERRARQSVAVHLISLCAALERGWPPERHAQLLTWSLAGEPAGGWPWLAPPPPVGTVTVLDVQPAGASDHAVTVRAWAQDVWDAYAGRHAVVRGWTDAVLGVEG